MYRVLWFCRICQHTWSTEGRSLFDVIDGIGGNGCPKKCSGLTGQVVLKEYGAVGTPRSATPPWWYPADQDLSAGAF
jgi:hypothetical protein